MSDNEKYSETELTDTEINEEPEVIKVEPKTAMKKEKKARTPAQLEAFSRAQASLKAKREAKKAEQKQEREEKKLSTRQERLKKKVDSVLDQDLLETHVRSIYSKIKKEKRAVKEQKQKQEEEEKLKREFEEFKANKNKLKTVKPKKPTPEPESETEYEPEPEINPYRKLFN